MIFHSLSTTAELIGQNCDSAAFIYGVISLADKFASGLIVMGVQTIQPSFEEECYDCASCRPFFSQVIFYVLGGAALVGALAMLSLVPFNIGGTGLRKELGKEASELGNHHDIARNSVKLTKFNSMASYPDMTKSTNLDENRSGENTIQISVMGLNPMGCY